MCIRDRSETQRRATRSSPARAIPPVIDAVAKYPVDSRSRGMTSIATHATAATPIALQKSQALTDRQIRRARSVRLVTVRYWFCEGAVRGCLGHGETQDVLGCLNRAGRMEDAAGCDPAHHAPDLLPHRLFAICVYAPKFGLPVLVIYDVI